MERGAVLKTRTVVGFPTLAGKAILQRTHLRLSFHDPISIRPESNTLFQQGEIT
jgi:hypothetical protein